VTRTRRRLLAAIQPTVVILLTATVIGIPLWLMFITSAKTQGEALTPNLELPREWNLVENYTQAFVEGTVPLGFFGSLLVMVPAVAGLLVLGAMAAWVLARKRGRINSVLYGAAISGIVLPPAVITLVLLLRQIGLAGSAIGMICVYTGMYLGVVIFFITGFVRTIPIELEEAARMDGARPVAVFARVILPLLAPVIATATILVCLYIWNDVFYSFFVLGGGQTSTLPLNLFRVASGALYQHNWNLIFAYVVIMSVPLLTVFLFAQRRIVSGITSGAVK
jgi:raffinose/stachyose/melibiose transport system permease protein